MANTNDVTFEIVEHIGVIDVIDNREEKWIGTRATTA